MSEAQYAAFLPEARQTVATIAPVNDWWSWRGHRIHITRTRRASPVRVVVVHGAGAHSAALWPTVAQLADRGLDVTAVDLPLYGRTESPAPQKVTYGLWLDLLQAFLDADDDGRPVLLLGASIGGLIAYEVAHRSDRVVAVAATCLLDPTEWRARACMTRFGPLAVVAPLFLPLIRGRAGDLMVPMRWVADLSKMSRRPDLSRLCALDPRGGGAKVPLRFFRSYMTYRHSAPEEFTKPLLLVHPTHDAWTPVELSTRFLGRLSGPTRAIMLRECGHFPVEEPGLTDLVESVTDLATRVSRG